MPSHSNTTKWGWMRSTLLGVRDPRCSFSRPSFLRHPRVPVPGMQQQQHPPSAAPLLPCSYLLPPRHFCPGLAGTSPRPRRHPQRRGLCHAAATPLPWGRCRGAGATASWPSHRAPPAHWGPGGSSSAPTSHRGRHGTVLAFVGATEGCSVPFHHRTWVPFSLRFLSHSSFLFFYLLKKKKKKELFLSRKHLRSQVSLFWLLFFFLLLLLLLLSSNDFSRGRGARAAFLHGPPSPRPSCPCPSQRAPSPSPTCTRGAGRRARWWRPRKQRLCRARFPGYPCS